MADLFSATASALGYLYQSRYALLLLIRDGKNNPGSAVTVEGLDDVAFEENGTAQELIQAKHHLNSTATLTDASSDIWKTIRVWADRVNSGDVRPGETTLTLLTTSTAKLGSAAAYLRPESSGKRDVSKALALLLKAATKSKAEAPSTIAAFKALTTLDKSSQEALLSSVRVLDAAPDIDQVRDEIVAAFDVFVRPEHKMAFVDRVEGWWFNKVVESMTGKSDRPIPYVALRGYINDLRDRFTEDDLPADFPDVLDLSEHELAPTQRVFIEQLRLVAARENAIRSALSDYWRAYQQRSRWVADGLLFDSDLEVYESTLIDEWSRYFDNLEYEIGDSDDDAILEKKGWAMYHKIDMDVSIPIRPKFKGAYVQRGTFHHLANTMQVGWHRDFVERLEGIVKEASESVE